MEEIIERVNKYVCAKPNIINGYYTWDKHGGDISIKNPKAFCFRSSYRGYILDSNSTYNLIIIRIL